MTTAEGNQESPRVVRIDVSSATTPRELHTLLQEALGFPAFYGRNWDAFHDAATGLVVMPEETVVDGFGVYQARQPKDAAICESVVRELKDEGVRITLR